MSANPSQASFNCRFCQKNIFIPVGLPPTTAPCPHCGKEVCSPDQNAPTQSPKPVPSAKSVANPVEKPVSKSTSSKAAPLESMPTQQARPKQLPVILAAVAILLIAAGVVYWFTTRPEEKNSAAPSNHEPPAGPSNNTQWRSETAKVLEGFMSAKTPEERMKFAIPNEGVLEDLKKYYAAGADDSVIPFKSFSFVIPNKVDSDRGIFLMSYRQPPQIDMRDFFVPIGSLNAVMKDDAASNLEMAYRIDSSVMADPLGVDAFFKETPDGLKLDASTFIQGKYRTFKNFTDYPSPGKKRTFRVVLNESVSHAHHSSSDYRSYRITDFSYPTDVATVLVKEGSSMGKQLAKLNWRGLGKPAAPSTATVELEWTDTSPSVLKISRLICWEFLGVGGDPSNVKAAEKPSAGQ